MTQTRFCARQVGRYIHEMNGKVESANVRKFEKSFKENEIIFKSMKFF